MIENTPNIVLLARNKNKKQHKIYIYEAMINMLNGFAERSVSENICAIVAAFLEKTNHDMSFLKDKDRLRINKICRAIT